jgi:hypothetical protein
MLEPWRGESHGLLMDDVYCIVRARIGKASVGPTEVEVTPRHAPYGMGPSWDVDVSVTTKRTSSKSDMIDLWLFDREHSSKRPDGRIVYGIKQIRINCEKFNWDILGKNKGLTEGNKADQLAVILGNQAPHAAVELNFAEFRDASSPAIGSSWSSTSAGGSKKDESGAFDFYSAWCGLMHWHRNSRKKS